MKNRVINPTEIGISKLNLAVILMSLAFLLGSYGSIENTCSMIGADSNGFPCRLNNVITGNVVQEPVNGANYSITDSVFLAVILNIIALAILTVIAKKIIKFSGSRN